MIIQEAKGTSLGVPQNHFSQLHWHLVLLIRFGDGPLLKVGVDEFILCHQVLLLLEVQLAISPVVVQVSR